MQTRRYFIQSALAAGAASQIALHPTNANARALGSSNDILQAARKVAEAGSHGLKILLPRGSEGNVNPIAELFAKETGASVDFIFADVDLINSKMLADKLSGENAFDIALPATFGLPDLVDANALLLLDTLDATYAATIGNAESLYPLGDAVLGAKYGFQTDGDVYVMFYRKSWLESEKNQSAFTAQTGNPLRVPRTWEELDQQIRFFNNPTNGQYGGALFRNQNYLVWEWWIRLHANGGRPVDDAFNPTINSDKGIRALQAIIDTTPYLYPGAKNNGLVENWRAFAEGEIYCNIGWGGSQKYFNRPDSPIHDDLVFGPTPGWERNGANFAAPYFNWGWNYTVSSQTPAPDLAYLFCRYAVSPDASTLAVQQQDGFFDPFLSIHYNDPAVIKAYGRPFLDIHKQSMARCIPDFYVSNHGFYIDALRENIQRAVRGGLTAQRALDLTAVQWRQITREADQEDLAAQWRAVLDKYPTDIRRHTN